MAPEGIKLPSDNTVASQSIRRNTATLTDAAAPTSKTDQAPPPNPLATVVLQSKAIIEGRKGELFQLLLQNDPKSDPPIKLFADTDIRPGTPLLLELDEQGHYQPVDSPNRAQIGKLIALELEFWQAHLFPKAAAKSTPSLPATETLVALAKQHPQLKPLIQWLVQRPSQMNSQLIRQWVQEYSPLTTLRTFPNPSTQDKNSNHVNIALNKPMIGQSTSAAQGHSSLQDKPQLQRPSPEIVMNKLVSQVISGAKTSPVNLVPLVTNNLGMVKGAQIGALSLPNMSLKSAPMMTPAQPFLKFASASLPKEQTNTLPHQKSDRTNLQLNLSTFTENTISAATRSKQWAPIIGQIPTVSPKALSTFIAEQSQTFKAVLISPAATSTVNTSATPTTLNVSNVDPANAIKSALFTSLPPTTTNQPTPTLNSFQKISNELFNFSVTKTPQTDQVQPDRSGKLTDSRQLIEVKLGQWLSLIDQTITKDTPDLAGLLRAKALSMLASTLDTGEKIQTDPKLHAQLPQPEKENSLNQLRSWIEAAQAKVLHQAVQTASAQWQAPELPVIQQMQLPLIWLGLTTWADIEWWQEKKKKQTEDEAEAEAKRRWRMRIYLNIEPLSEFCADIDWHPSDTHLVFWSEDAATLSHLNTLVPMLKDWTHGLSSESVIQTRHGMPKRASDQQLKRSNHHLVDIKT